MIAAGRLTVLEHQPIPIGMPGDPPAEGGLTRGEVDRLLQVNAQRPGFCEVGVRQVTLAQHCGIVGLGERVLEVLPKTQDAMESPQECRGVLLRLLHESGQLPRHEDPAVGQHLRHAPLLDAFIAAYFDALAAVLRGGLLRRYRSRAEDLPVVRGRIDFARQWGPLSGRGDRVACVVDDLLVDHVWNRVLKAALRSTRPWIRDVALGRRWIELMQALDEVDDTRLQAADLQHLHFDRQAERLRPAIAWARALLQGLSPSLRAGEQRAPALLFDMNRVFESSMAAQWHRRLQRAEVSGGWTLHPQDRGASLATQVSAQRVTPAFALRPDLVLRQGGLPRAVADTKWKRLSCDRHGTVLPAEADVLQMHAYAAAYECHDLTLIYPWHDGLRRARLAEYRLPPVQGRAPLLRVLCVDVHHDELPARLGAWPQPEPRGGGGSLATMRPCSP